MYLYTEEMDKLSVSNNGTINLKLFASNVMQYEVYKFTFEIFLPKRFNLYPLQL